MEKACALCTELVLDKKPHSALKKISELKGSELYKCCCCYAYLHKHNSQWEIISAGDRHLDGDISSSIGESNTSTGEKLAFDIAVEY